MKKKSSLKDVLSKIPSPKPQCWLDQLPKNIQDEVKKELKAFYEGRYPNLSSSSLARALVEHYGLKTAPSPIRNYIHSNRPQ